MINLDNKIVRRISFEYKIKKIVEERLFNAATSMKCITRYDQKATFRINSILQEINADVGIAAMFDSILTIQNVDFFK